MKRFAPAVLRLIAVLMIGAGVALADATTKPINQDASALGSKLSKMPKHLWPSESEQPVNATARQAWIARSVFNKPDKIKFTGTISAIDSGTTLVEHKKVAVVVLDCGKIDLWGGKFQVEVKAVLPNTSPEKAAEWRAGDTLVILGIITAMGDSVVVNGNKINVLMGDMAATGNAVVVPSKSK